ncbi:hypothetical protein KDA00_04190 [Candidatus Saccharibacteria bacterium]|nr:hypothetical protein [Candidatus Saccharibacteria bacterium]
MHIFFCGIGGTGIGPLAMIAKEAGYDVSGTDKQDSQYIQYLRKHGIESYIGQSYEAIENLHKTKPIDWVVYSSAVAIEDPNFPEKKFCEDNQIKCTKRDDFLNHLLQEKNQKLIAIAGTHGKTTTTAMTIWLLKYIDITVSYTLGAKTSFGNMGHFNPDSEYFIYEADEFDRNFLSFNPYMSIISGVDYDHPDIYPTREDYEQAFRNFIGQSRWTVLWGSDFDRLKLEDQGHFNILSDSDTNLQKINLLGEVNRRDAWLVIQAVNEISGIPIEDLIAHMSHFPGISRRFEEIAPNLYSDYAHTPEKIRGAIQIAKEKAANNVVVVYEGLHNTRQHFIKKDLEHLFDDIKKLYIVPSYLAREDKSLELLTPDKLIALTSQPEKGAPSTLDEILKKNIDDHCNNGDLVLCLTAGGGGSLDEWLRKEYKK